MSTEKFNLTSHNTFFTSYALAGYLPDLLPVIPPNAKLTAGSKISPHSLGKIPGGRTAAGEWHGLRNWAGRESATMKDVQTWATWEDAGLCIRTGRLIAFDIDVLSADLAGQLEDIIVGAAGPVPVRFGKAPKRLLAYRAAEPMTKWVAEFDVPGVDGVQKIECLGQGQQFVAEGIHPKTGQPYHWRDDRSLTAVPFDSLPLLTVEQVREIQTKLTAYLEQFVGPVNAAASSSSLHSERRPIGDPALMAKDQDTLFRALECMPNELDRESWIAMTAAVKAACGGSDEGYEAYEAFSLRWADNTPEVCQAAWDSISDAEVGADYVYACARRHGFTEVSDFDPLPADEGEPNANVVSAAEPAPAAKPKLFMEWATDIKVDLTARDFVEGILVEKEMSVVYGAPNCGKSFFAADLALHVALGWEWRGREVDQGAVIYVAAEAGTSFTQRIAAFVKVHGLEGKKVPFAVVPCGIDMTNSEADTTELIALIEQAVKAAGMPVKLVVIDTLAEAFRGDENSGQDMGRFLQCCSLIRRNTGAHLMVIHHSGKDAAKGARGHSSLKGSVDTEIELTRDEERRVSIGTLIKQRNYDKSGVQFAFSLESVTLGMNRRNKPVTSCVCRPADAPTKVGKGPTGKAAMALNELRNMIAAQEEFTGADLVDLVGDGAGHSGASSKCHGVRLKDWRDQAVAAEIVTREDRKGWSRICVILNNYKAIFKRGGMVYLTPTDAAGRGA